MAKFPQDLNDGGHWFHSGILISEHTSKRGLITNHFSSYMDDLAQQLSALTLLKQNHRNFSKPPPKTSLNLQHRFGQVPVRPVRCGQENPSCHCQGCLSLNNNRFRFVPKPDYENNINNSEINYKYHIIRKPVQPNQVDVFLEDRGSFLQRQHHHNNNQLKLNKNRVLQNRLGGGFGVGGVVKVTGGTGVFHPRVCSSNSNNTPRTTEAAYAKKKQVLMKHNRSEIQVPQMNSTTTGSFGHCPIPPEMVLPKDWTY